MRMILILAGLICALPGAVLAVEAGQAAPLFKGAPLQGRDAVDLASFRGKVVYLDFWASWCGPCRQSLPEFEKMRAELGPQGFEIVAVNLDENPQDGLDFLKKYPVTYPTVRDPQGDLARMYDVKAMPSSYLIGRDGKVRIIKLGFHKNDMPKLRNTITALIREE